MQLLIRDISKAYPDGVQALKNVTLTMPTGMYGLLGPNGAGKSTLMRILATLQDADSGSAQLGDLDVLHDKDGVRKTLGYLPQEFGVHPRVSAVDLLAHFALLRGLIRHGERREVVEGLLRQVDLWEVRTQKLGGFSGGMRQRFGRGWRSSFAAKYCSRASRCARQPIRGTSRRSISAPCAGPIRLRCSQRPRLETRLLQVCELPDQALLRKYRESGAFTDCYLTECARPVTHAQFVEAFYTTWVFKLERVLLDCFAAKPSTDAQAHALATGTLFSFAAWHVEGRASNQLLMCDFRGRTRSWLMIEAIPGDRAAGTRLYFGSAVVPVVNAGRSEMGGAYRALLGFHKIYSRVLLHAASARLLRGQR